MEKIFYLYWKFVANAPEYPYNRSNILLCIVFAILISADRKVFLLQPESCSCPAFGHRNNYIYCVGFTGFVLDVPLVRLCRNRLEVYAYLPPCICTCFDVLGARTTAGLGAMDCCRERLNLLTYWKYAKISILLTTLKDDKFAKPNFNDFADLTFLRDYQRKPIKWKKRISWPGKR